jgi:hypothetical protein
MFVSVKYLDGTLLYKIPSKSFWIGHTQNTCNTFSMLNPGCNIVNKNNRVHIVNSNMTHMGRRAPAHCPYVSVKSLDGTLLFKIPSKSFWIGHTQNTCNAFCMLNPGCTVVNKNNRVHIVMQTRLCLVPDHGCGCGTQCGCVKYVPVPARAHIRT